MADWFENLKDTLETAYLSHAEPWRQSGMSGPEERWVSLRKPVADCVDRSGTFLDIGCANGYLLECILRWTAERGLQVNPFGLDISEKLVSLARLRLPQYESQLFVGNAFTWQPPRRFDFVRTELVYVQAEQEKPYLERLLQLFLAPGGSLLVANYMEDLPHPEAGMLPGSFPTRYIQERLAQLGYTPSGFQDGFDPIKGRKVRIAILSAP